MGVQACWVDLRDLTHPAALVIVLSWLCELSEALAANKGVLVEICTIYVGNPWAGH
jgi:hypothetical protein